MQINQIDKLVRIGTTTANQGSKVPSLLDVDLDLEETSDSGIMHNDFPLQLTSVLRQTNVYIIFPAKGSMYMKYQFIACVNFFHRSNKSTNI